MRSTGGTIIRQHLKQIKPNSELNSFKIQLNAEWKRLGSRQPGKSSATRELGEDGLVGDWKNPDASVLHDARLGGHSKISVGAWVDGVESAHKIFFVAWVEGVDLWGEE